MKKLIAILVVFALAMGAAFAETTVSGAVFGDVTLFGSSTADNAEIEGSGGMGRVRIEAAGGDDDGKFGAWIRLDKGEYKAGMANVWWKPIDQFRLLIGGNADGMYGKEGVTGWGFYQTPTDTNVTFGGDNVWGWGVSGDGGGGFGAGVKTRDVFYGGFGDDALMLEIKPVEMFGVNIVLPYFAGGEVADIFASLVIQFDLNLDFGNIALTYEGPGKDNFVKVKGSDASGFTIQDDGKGGWEVKPSTPAVPDAVSGTKDMGKLYLYAGIPIGDSVALDIGLSFTLPGEVEGYPIGIGAGVKVGITETFGLKARIAATLLGDEKKNDGATRLLVDVLPYFSINDLMTVFVSVGLTTVIPGADAPSTEKVGVAFHFNPYLTVGSEWGPKFLVGFKLFQEFAVDGKGSGGGDPIVGWSVPIALQCSF